MYRRGVRILVTVIVVFAVSFPLEAATAIGVAVARGRFQVDGSLVSGNATVFEGTMLETGDVASELQLQGGERLLLGSGSKGKVFRNHLLLERGVTEVAGGTDYRVEARGLRVASKAPAAAARVELEGDRLVRVAALKGTLRVTTAAGRTIAFIEPGSALLFEPQAPGELPEFTMTGCLERRDSRYVIRDLVAGVIEEVRGSGLERYVGDVVEVTGRDLPGVKPVTDAEEVVQIIRIRRVSRGCPAGPPPKAAPPPPEAPPAPTPPAAQTPAPPPPSGGRMSGAAKAVIAGVVVGGAGAGAAVFLLRKKDSGTISR